jgi:hypothetical protein
VGAGLVGDHVGGEAAPRQLAEDVGGVAEQPHRDRPAGAPGRREHRQRLVERGGAPIQVAGGDPLLDPARVALHRDHREAGHGGGQRLGAPHAAQAAGEDPAPAGLAAEVLLGHGAEGLPGPLHDPLAADVDPGAGRHLAVHHQPLSIELVEVLPAGPARHQVGVGQQHPRRVGVGAEDAHRLAALDEQRLLVAEPPQRGQDGVEGRPVARRPADAAVDHQRLGVLGHLGVEVVLQHPVGRLGEPAAAAERRSARRTDDTAGIVAAVHPVAARGGR